MAGAVYDSVSIEVESAGWRFRATHSSVKFNGFTAPDLDYAPYVQLLMDPNGKCFALMVCDKEAVFSSNLNLAGSEKVPLVIPKRSRL